MTKHIVHLKLFTFVLLFGMAIISTYAQEAHRQTRKGNKAYEEKNYNEATELYQNALKENEGFTKAHNNLASTYYRKEEYKKASEHFEKAVKNETDSENLAEYYYNLGNSLMQLNELDKSIEAYKNALRIDPQDRQAKHNLSLANKKKQQQQNQQNQQNQDQQNNDQDKEQQQQNQQQDQQQQNQQEQNRQQQEQEQQPQDQQQQGQPKDQIQKEDAERLLNLIEQNEKELLKKLEEKKSKQQKRDAEKNW
jgi:tetratricopeptide (TPR) repeat protein